MPRPSRPARGALNWDTYVESVFDDVYDGPAGTPSPSATYIQAPIAPAPSGGDDTAALQALFDAGGDVTTAPGVTYVLTGTTGLVLDVSKARLIGRRTKIDASAMTSGQILHLTSTAGDPAEYHSRNGSWIEGVELIGPGKTSSVDGVLVSASGGASIAHGQASFVVHDVRHGIALGDNAHNLTFDADVYSAARCVDDSAAATNAGERIVFRGALFNSDLAAYLHNGNADYQFEGSFDYNKAVFDIDACTVTCVGCHTEGNDTQYGTNYPFTLTGNGSLVYVGGILTGALTTIPAYVHAANTGSRAIFDGTRIYGWSGAMGDGAGATVVRTAEPLPGERLGWVAYNPAGTTALSTTSTTFVNVDSTNVTLAFTVPHSGAVDIIAEAVVDVGSAGVQAKWNLRDGGGDVAGTEVTMTRTADSVRVTHRWHLTGLTPGAYSVNLGQATSDGAFAARVLCGGTYGPVSLLALAG